MLLLLLPDIAPAQSLAASLRDIYINFVQFALKKVATELIINEVAALTKI